jgi:hypothetical protein
VVDQEVKGQGLMDQEVVHKEAVQEGNLGVKMEEVQKTKESLFQTIIKIIKEIIKRKGIRGKSIISIKRKVIKSMVKQNQMEDSLKKKRVKKKKKKRPKKRKRNQKQKRKQMNKRKKIRKQLLLKNCRTK